MAISPSDFIKKWSKVSLSERSSYQQHFLDLCELAGHPKPAEADPMGDSFCFERGAEKHGGGDGWADVWKRGFFAFEYKGRHANLAKAYDQILRYRASLENPPLLVVCDTDLIEIHTNFTGTAEVILRFTTAEIDRPRNLEILRLLFHQPEKLRPGRTSEAITQDAASALAGLAGSLRARHHDPEAAARFLDRIVFCLFAEDVGLLPDGVFGTLLENTKGDPERFSRYTAELFRAMAAGGEFQYKTIPHFNGGLFSDPVVLALDAAEIAAIHDAAKLDWGAVDPSIFGTLFQRGLDPATRAALGAEYTGRQDIEDLIEPVLIAPLRREWEAIRKAITNLLQTGKKHPKPGSGLKPPTGPALRKALAEAASLKHAFLVRLARIHVLDPACGSGNFLYISLQKLKDLEKEVILFGADDGVETAFFPSIGPWQFHGLEINPYAFELAQMTLWIGYLQWHRGNGYPITETPLLKKLDNFHLMDALLDLSDPANPKEAAWPVFRADHEVVVVGNPPFLGGKMMRRELGDDYVSALLACYNGRVPAEADLCCYWFEKARALIEAGKIRRAGLLATQGIRGGANREVLKRIKESGEIFFAVSDRDWILDGANVHISMVGFEGRERTVGFQPALMNEAGGMPAVLCVLDGKPVAEISPSLTAGSDAREAAPYAPSLGIGFMGITPAGPFDLPFDQVRDWLAEPNPHGHPNSDVLRPYLNGKDINQRSRGQWTVDFTGLGQTDAALYEKPFAHLDAHVRPERATNNRENYRNKWWLYAEAREGMRKALAGHSRYLATCMVAKHRLFSWLSMETLPANVVIVFARSDDFFFGVLHSRIHEAWSLAQGTQLEDRPRYTPTTCFETFPFPWDHRLPVAELSPEKQAHHARISQAARALDDLRTRWLNPPEWTREEVLEFPATPGGPWTRFIESGNGKSETGKAALSGDSSLSGLRSPNSGLANARYPRLVPRDADCAKRLADRTLTKLYNARPAWLASAHAELDAAVSAAYGWPDGLAPDEIIARLLAHADKE